MAQGQFRQSQPLLKFLEDGTPVLDPAGLELVGELHGRICPFVFLGDGRAGKSFLASVLLGQEGVFTSSDSSESVTEGIDIAVGAAGGAADYFVVLDCEGGNNALAEIHSLVNVFALVACTHVVFVANNMASEAAMQNLASAVAARSVVHACEGSGFELPQRLTFVVNKTTLKYSEDALEKLLNCQLTGEGVAGRDEMRQDIKGAFSERRFVAVKHSALPGYEQSVATFKESLCLGPKPLTVAGAPVDGGQLCKLFEVIAQGVQQMNRVSAPSMTRAIVFDSFLKPLVDKLLGEAKSMLPTVSDYDPEIEEQSPCPGTLAAFDEATAHLPPGPMLHEARELLSRGLQDSWGVVLRKNFLLGEETTEVATETREVVESEDSRCLGGNSLLRKLMVIEQTIRTESRAVARKRAGGEPVASGWQPNGHFLRLRESRLEEQILALPRMQGRLVRRTSSLGRVFGTYSYESCFCVLWDLHLMWWVLPHCDGEPAHCLSLLDIPCCVSANTERAAEASFEVRFEEPVDALGADADALWFQQQEPLSWSTTLSCCVGLQRHAGTLSGEEAVSGAQTQAKWVSRLAEHIALARSTATVARQPTPVVPPTLSEVLETAPAEFRGCSVHF